MNVKTISMYLPQFHRIKENDDWWGKGYTEWTAVKKAKALYDGHYQPRIPLNKYYYDLMDKSVMEQQAEWMKQYGIYGQCIYHYYFKDGRKVLEKPAENLLKWKDIDIKFFFSWANQRWARTWSNIEGNSWADLYEKKNGGPDILLAQKYGREKEWEQHIQYLLPFFDDDRYIKVDGKPVFMFHNPELISCLYPMVEYFNQRIKDYGYTGIFFIGTSVEYDIEGMDAMLQLAPHAFWKSLREKMENGIIRPEYDILCENALKGKCISQEGKTFFSVVADCDDTPRRGKNGVSMKGFTIEKFQQYLVNMYVKSEKFGNEFMFINAWNEWAEGMYLEPDERNGFACLEAVKNAQEIASRMLRKPCDNNKNVVQEKGEDDLKIVIRRARLMANCFDKWLSLKERGIDIEDCLKRFEINSIAIYGYGRIGKHLLSELNDSDIEIRCIIDLNADLHNPSIDIISPTESVPNVDAIIVTVLWDYENIYKTLRKNSKTRIFSIMELIDDLLDG